ncbi:hypothetical protein G2W53_010387 [Senna tora]|uniref:Uncharacterized protein n=1 Tax=Senna tora TaxID=362788 RepID=A0A834X0Y1_9FABA|nr:hypothetical protein G2W53_010387 [Senna tora]
MILTFSSDLASAFRVLLVIIDSQPLTVAVLAALLFGESIGIIGAAGLVFGVIGLVLLEVHLQRYGKIKEIKISQSESEAAAPAPARTPSSFSGPTVTPTLVPAPTPSLVPAPTPSQSTEPPPETTQHFTSCPTSTPTSAPIPDEVSKQCNRYWTIDIIGIVRQGRLKVLEVWSLPLGKRVVVPFNAQAQPVGEAAGLLSGFLGLVVTDVATFPISYHSWDKVPNSYKESCFNSIKVIRIPLNSGSDPAGDVALQEIARLKLQLEANKSQTKSFMTFVLRNLGLESVPPEFADLINPQVSDANSAEPPSTGHQSSQA